jgi:hypothetical protein
MAKRQARLIIKNSVIPSQSLPSSGIFQGEGLVNLGDGILYFSGGTAGSPTWVPSDNNSSYFEVGSNIYDLKIRNRIVGYEGLTNVSGKFLSGTTSGFTLADISSISGVDSYVTGGTYNSGTDIITLTFNEGKPNVNITGVTDYFTTGVTFDGSIAYFDRNDTLSAYTLDLSTFVSTADTYTTAFTYDNANELTISRNQGQPDLSVTINEMTGLTVNGTLTAQTIDGGTILSGGTNLTDIFSQNDFFTTGGTLIGDTVYFDRNDALSAYTVDLSALDVNDAAVTAYTYNSANNTFTIGTTDGQFTAQILQVSGMTNTGNLDLQGELANSTGNVVINDNLDITGDTTSWGNILPGTHLTYNLGAQGQRWDNLWVRKVNIGTSTTTLEDDGSNFTMSGNNGNFIFIPSSTGDTVIHSDVLPDADLTRTIGRIGQRWNIIAGDLSATGLTLSNLTAGRVVYVGAGGQLVDEAGFEYNDTTNTLTAANGVFTNDLEVQGDLTVLGDSISAFTSELYIEDNNITLNYNPTGDTSVSSVNAGTTIQDGDGAGNDVNWDIVRMQALSGLTAGENPDLSEYTAGTGYANRGFITQLNDIIIRSTDVVDDSGTAGDVTGVRVLAEFDCIDGGTY